MEKLTIIASISFLFLLSSVTSISAQRTDNKYDCNFNSSGDCVPTNIGCTAGNDVDPSVCANADNCQGTINQACVPVAGAQKCSCISGVCTPDANGSMTCGACNSPSANAACTTSTPRFKCSSTQNGCEPCTAGSPGCTLSAADCANSCTANLTFQRCDTTRYACVNCVNESDPGCVPASTCLTQCRVPTNTYDSLKCSNGSEGIDTAIGCIPITSLTSLAGFFLNWGLGIAGGVAFLMILFSGFLIMTSAGDPKRLQTGQELMTSAVSGVILLIFSIFVLRLIGVNILGLF